MEMSVEQKARAWDQFKLIIARAVSDESRDKEFRDLMSAFIVVISDIESDIQKKESKYDGANGA